ncbi:MAG: hypothetical protein FJ118_15985 [Deltaproteobacteria bacterium]|nr:hypothetical protein [Deltaproteobacteria bacterium]
MNEQRIQLWLALVALALGGMIVHYKLHPLEAELTHVWPFAFSVADLLVVSLLFAFKSTAVWGLLLNSFLAMLGIIMMTDLGVMSVVNGWVKVGFFQNPIAWMGDTMVSSVATTFTDFLAGLALYSVTIGKKK